MLALILMSAAPAWAQGGGVPNRQIPPSVLAEVQELENRFELALAADCDPKRCFPKGCTYVDHAVADQPRTTSLPGLGETSGPGSVAAQEYLTRARCSFVHEDSISSTDVQSLVRRLQSKLSKGWVVVTVERSALEPIPQGLQDPPKPEEVPAEEPEPVVKEWSASLAARELWTSLLPHFAWMIAVVLLTSAVLVLVWAWRRVGRESLEERALMDQLNSEAGETEATPKPAEKDPSEDDRIYVARQTAAWTQRLAQAGGDSPDPELRAMIRELLRARDLPLLAKAVLQFPDSFLSAFPKGGDIATAKLELAEYLKSVDARALPSDLDFFRSLDRHARAAALLSQSDAEIIRSLREEFGATGLVGLIDSVPARTAALLFALSPAEEQHEMVRLLSEKQMRSLCEQLLRSNRMPRGETSYLFRVLEAARAEEVLPPPPLLAEVADRGSEFDAAGALSILLPSLPREQRAAMFREALGRFQGNLPAWYRGIFVPDMLSFLPSEPRKDLLLELDAETLAAWLSLSSSEAKELVLADLPEAMRASISAFVPPSRARLLSLAWRARQELAKGFQQKLTRAALPFERVVQSSAPEDP